MGMEDFKFNKQCIMIVYCTGPVEKSKGITAKRLVSDTGLEQEYRQSDLETRNTWIFLFGGREMD